MTWISLSTQIKALAHLGTSKASSASKTAIALTANGSHEQSALERHIEPQLQSKFLQLPPEVLLVIRQYLSTLDVVLLAHTCHYMRRFLEADQLPKSTWYTKANESWLQTLLRKDKCYAVLEKHSSGLESSELAVCGDLVDSCMDIHHISMFSPEELQKEPFQRHCRARTTSLKVCSHVQICYRQFEELVSQFWDKKVQKFTHVCSQAPGGSKIQVLDLTQSSHPEAEQSWNRGWRKKEQFQTRYMLMYDLKCIGTEGRFTWSSWTDENQDWYICDHLKLGDVLPALEPLIWTEKYADVTCEKCSTRISRTGLFQDWNDEKICVERSLGYGGHVPDKWWRAAVGLQ